MAEMENFCKSLICVILTFNIFLSFSNSQYVPNAIKNRYGSGYSEHSMGGVKTGVKTVKRISGPTYIKTSYIGTHSGGMSAEHLTGGYYSGEHGGGYFSGEHYSSGNDGGSSHYISHGSHDFFQAGCSPPCQNGGKCVGIVCLCPSDYTGLQCQYLKSTCSFKKMNFNGGYRCSDDTEVVTCSVTCPEGSSFEYTPAQVYSCQYMTGQYQPSVVPQCILDNKNSRFVGGHYSSKTIKDSKIIRINSTKTGMSQYTKTKIIRIKPQPGSCFTWGGSHYKTFDGKVYSFSSNCSHVLVKDAVDNTFEITVKNSKECSSNSENCHRVIKIFIQDKQYYLKRSNNNNIVFGTSEKNLPIPSQLPALRVSKLGHFVILSLDSIGAKLKWDGEQLVQIEVLESLWNKTEGLCGKLDGDPSNDLMGKNGRHPKNIFTLATSWKADDFGEVCSDVPSEKHACKNDQVTALKATTFCKKLITLQRFTPCHKVMETNVLLDACKWDYCACTKSDPTECACEAMNIYVKECTHKGINLLNWRDQNTCPILCSGGTIYKSCGPTTQPSCGAALEDIQESQETCIEGCFCPEGTVLQDGKCITKDQCPCQLRGKNFYPGDTIRKDCNTCTCQNGQWICTELSCGARCSIIGDPHYTTFDGKHYDFMGQCSYYLVKARNFSIEAENIACAGSISHSFGFTDSISGVPSCTKSVTVSINGHKIALKQNHDVVVDGKDIHQFPHKIDDITIKWITATFIHMQLGNGLKVWWDGSSRVYIDIPANFDEKTKGLCGTYNNNQKDDFLTPENDVERSPILFANKWKTSEKCSDIPDVLTPHPCDVNVHKKIEAETHCKILKSQHFQSCHWHVDPEQFYQDCLYDMCSCGNTQISKCMCPIIASYAEACTRQGLQIDWRSEVKECGIQCTGGQKYQVCGNSCFRTCADISEGSLACNQQCVEGCSCPEGQALDDNGECVTIDQCNCRYNGLDFPPDYKEIRYDSGEPQLCTCVNAAWSCHLATKEDEMNYSEFEDQKSKCNISDNFEHTTCKYAEQITCKNMDTFVPMPIKECTPGCQCKKGYVLDTISKRCVKPSECPCHHGGKSFGENEGFQMDCNSCICQQGQWRCSEVKCSGECSAWGDSHYKTFDGKHYDYQGQCDYVLAKGSIAEGSFDISIQNVPCGTLGTSCSKSISIRVSSGSSKESITLTRHKALPKFDEKTQLTLRERGLFVIVEAQDLGLIILWDKGTRVYVKLDPRWKNKVKGLCGNYNDNSGDDFQTPSGGINEASVKIFGDSWRLQSYCPEAVEIIDTCEGRPDRKVWALKKCGLLKSSIFARCHAEVPVADYFDRCVFDSCACDEGGDCECLCTALAAYAEECNKKGIHIKWRSQELCPIQCDERCSSYSPCVSTCPMETCENLLTQSKLSKSCAEESCVEGCMLKPCPIGQVYYNSSYSECVPRKSCKTICMEKDDKTYYEGDILSEDECHSCICSRGQELCKGQPCSKIDISPTVEPSKVVESIKCRPGWTKWINMHRVISSGTKSTKVMGDEEAIPTIGFLNSLYDSAVCEKSDMAKIQCRTIRTKQRWNETGFDVECNLEKGLICKPSKGRSCPDFQIRVFCQCEKTTNSTIEEIKEITKSSKCPPGEVYEECAIECDQMCQFYSSQIRESGVCQGDDKCSPGCVPEDKPKCPQGKIWASQETCVAPQDCMCRSRSGHPVKPGTVYQESDCEFCQCVDNFYVCDKSACIESPEVGATPSPLIEEEEEEEEETITIVEPEVTEIETIKTDEIFIPSTVTPPNKCDDKNYIELIDGETPLADSAFNASSTSNAFFSPWFARINSKITDNSGGSWSPKESTPDQYLEINLGRVEPIYGVIIKGSPLYDEYVTSFKIYYSADGVKYCYVIDEDKKPQIFRGSLDAKTPVKEMFIIPIEAKIVRINPQTWNNGISLRVELIGCKDTTDVTPPTKVPPKKPPISTTTPTTEYEKEPMGVADEMMCDEQITVSSEYSPKFNKSHLRIDDDYVWQPFFNSPSEFVQFDFYEERLVSGIMTKGGPNGWVTSYKIQYSPDCKNWNPILNENGKENKFLGNYDKKNTQTNYFIKPLKTRCVKIIPLSWKKNIQLQVELLGEKRPYPVPPKCKIPIKEPRECKYCPGLPILQQEEESECQCKQNTWFDGENCVSRAQCPCFIGNNPFPVGGMFENENCDQCFCKLGGIHHCKPKKCPKCDQNLRSTVTSSCDCTCQPCPEGTTLCPTTNICIKSEFWCDGVQNCPDDEIDCKEQIIRPEEETTVITETHTVQIICRSLTCPPGYKSVQRDTNDDMTQFWSPMFSGYSKTKTMTKTRYQGTKSFTKGGVKTGWLKRPTNNTATKAKCPEYYCVPISIESEESRIITEEKECPVASCPPNFKIIRDFADSSEECPSYSCLPPPPKEGICNITGNVFNTFDGIEYEYDICNHIVARDLANDNWDLTLRKICEKNCIRTLIIRHQENSITLYPNLTVEYDGYKYSIDQTKKIGSQTQAFSISRLGNTLLFTSNRFGFWIIWDNQANVKFGVVRKLLEEVDGLCGYFNDNPRDDKRKPDGSLARTSIAFGESWGLPDQTNCKPTLCPAKYQSKALQVCNKVKDETFAVCGKKMDVQAFISRCVETSCACFENSISTLEDDECKCQALQKFAIDCLSVDSEIDLSHWRMQHDCPATCEAPLVHHDCYQRKCEPTCETISDPDACPKIPQVCFPGCYCPPGLVRHGDSCIQPSTCRDCECNVLPHLKYVTYDQNNFTIDGNCTYIMSRDILSDPTDAHKFQVLVTNGKCRNNQEKACIEKVTVLYKDNKLEVFNNILRNELKLLINGRAVTDFKNVTQWIDILRTATKHLKIKLSDIQVEISVYYPSLGVSIKAPSQKYRGKLEGLCGDCDKNPKNDLPTTSKSTVENVNELAETWLYGDQNNDKCQNPPPKECEELPPESDPCLQLLDSNKFGQCLAILDPGLFLEWCKKDTCGNHPELSCTAIEAYARDCANAGFCINWRTSICPPKSCPIGQEYNACGTSCPKTCQNKDEPHKNCLEIPTEGCFCPEGKIRLNNTCVEEKNCEVCDEEGHHPGDTWQKDKCTNCTCDGTILRCQTQQCSGSNIVCEKGFTPLKIPAGAEECCDKVACVQENNVTATCETPQKLVCGPGQVTKLDTKPNGCQHFICECKPPEECDEVNTTEEPLEDGYIKEIDNSGCCPVANLVCKLELCPKPPQCKQYHILDEIPGKCCPTYKCLPPPNKCLYEIQYTLDENGGERERTEFEKQEIVKNVNETWEDGPCRVCKCIETSSGDFIATCTQSECPTIELSPDYTEYVLEFKPNPEQCCPNIVRTACLYEGRTYSVGEKWNKYKDICTTFECRDTPTGIQKEVLVTSCDTNCDLGFEYEPSQDPNKCCGTCKSVACVVNDNLYKVDETWQSDDHCTNFYCVMINGSAQIQSVLENCPKVPEDYEDDYVIDQIPIEGQCCKKIEITACRTGDQIYKVGESVPSPDGDKCKHIICTKNDKNETIKQTNTETCNKDCSKGYEYQESEEKCCGECVPIACVVGDELKAEGDQWLSDDLCTTYSCDKISGQFSVSAQQESCPSLEDCPEENIYVKGCCKYCNLTKESLSNCAPTPLPLPKTVGLIQANHTLHGFCVNKESITGFMDCTGSCHSSQSYNPVIGAHEAICECCRGIKFKPTEIELQCEDNFIWKKKIQIPISCRCQSCTGSSSYTKSIPSSIKNIKTG